MKLYYNLENRTIHTWASTFWLGSKHYFRGRNITLWIVQMHGYLARSTASYVVPQCSLIMQKNVCLPRFSLRLLQALIVSPTRKQFHFATSLTRPPSLIHIQIHLETYSQFLCPFLFIILKLYSFGLAQRPLWSYSLSSPLSFLWLFSEFCPAC